MRTANWIWAALVSAAMPACATAIQDDPDPAPTVKKDAGVVDTGKQQQDSGVQQDTGVMQDTGVQEDTGSMTCQRTIEYGDPGCDTCMEQNCCAADNACGNSQACGDFITCVDDCFGDGGNPNTCMTDCGNKYPQGYTLFNNVGNCMSQSCPNDCR